MISKAAFCVRIGGAFFPNKFPSFPASFLVVISAYFSVNYTLGVSFNGGDLSLNPGWLGGIGMLIQ